MSQEELQKKAKNFTDKSNNDNTTSDNNKEEKEVKKVTKKKREGAPTKVLEIDRDFVEAFWEKASPADREWIEGMSAKLVLEKGSVKYFAAFRSEFAKKFFPELVAPKASQKNESMLDYFERRKKEGVK